MIRWKENRTWNSSTISSTYMYMLMHAQVAMSSSAPFKRMHISNNTHVSDTRGWSCRIMLDVLIQVFAYRWFKLSELFSLHTDMQKGEGVLQNGWPAEADPMTESPFLALATCHTPSLWPGYVQTSEQSNDIGLRLELLCVHVRKQIHVHEE